MRVAFVTPSFFGYETAIADALRASGIHVDVFDERPSNSAIGRAFLRVAPSLASSQIRGHFRKILDRTRGTHYDGILVVKGETTPTWFLREFAAANEEAVRVFYTFDSISNSSKCVHLFGEFDRLYSFDRRDAAAWSELEYKPLFYAEEFRSRPTDPERRLTASFVGTLHSDRYAFFRAVTRDLDPRTTYAYFYSQAPWFFALKKIFDKRTRAVHSSEVMFSKLPRSAVGDIFRTSRAVIDFQRPGQAGLTMRTFEALGAGARLITANDAVTLEPFYDPERILVVPSLPDAIDSAAVAEWVLRPLDESWNVPESLKGQHIAAWVGDFVKDFSGVASR